MLGGAARSFAHTRATTACFAASRLLCSRPAPLPARFPGAPAIPKVYIHMPFPEGKCGTPEVPYPQWNGLPV